VSCLDIACREGWFSFRIARRGVQLVKGIDIRPERIERADFVRGAGTVADVLFEVRIFLRLPSPTMASVSWLRSWVSSTTSTIPSGILDRAGFDVKRVRR